MVAVASRCETGRAYVTGETDSANYPTTSGAFDRTFNGGISDAYVTKLNASGSALAYSTFLGGMNSDSGFGIAVDRNGRAYVTGFTSSTDYPITCSVFDRTFNGNRDAFVTKLPTVERAAGIGARAQGGRSPEGPASSRRGTLHNEDGTT